MPQTKTKTLIDFKKVIKPLISKLRYGLVALILAGFIFTDILNILYLIGKGDVHRAYAEPSLEKLILSVFGAELSLWSTMNVQSVFDLDSDTTENQSDTQIFGFVLCLLPVLAAVVQACFRALEHHITNVIHVQLSSVVITSHNTFTLIYSTVALALLLDIASFFIRGWCKERKHS